MKTTIKIVAASCCLCGALIAQSKRLDSDQQIEFEQRQRIDFEDPQYDPLIPMAERESARQMGGSMRTLSMPPQGEMERRFSPAGTISVNSLANPLSSKSRKIVEKAEEQIRKHDYSAAKKTLNGAMGLEDARPYALAMSGTMHLTQYIHEKDPRELSAAYAELIEAVPLLPSDVGARSNLGLAHYFMGELDQAFAEASKALQLDPARARTRYVIGVILCGQRRYSEALFHLKQAAAEMQAARELLPQVEKLAESVSVAEKEASISR